MILTVTLNPSVDISYALEVFELDRVNRVSDVSKTPGGKGLNVARVLHDLGEEVAVTGCIGGENGRFILNHLPETIHKRFYKITGNTRNCIAILHQGQQTELLETGPLLDLDASDGFVHHFKYLLDSVEVITISGSLPQGVPEDYYRTLIRTANAFGKKTVLDCSGHSLRAVLEGSDKPTAIKPNREELSAILGKEVGKDIDELKSVLSQPLFEGIEWIIISLGADGTFAKHGSSFYKVDIPKIKVVNPVGSGDSTVAGIASALSKHEDDTSLLIKANVLGMLNAQEKTTGHVDMSHYDELYQSLTVRKV